MKKFQVELKAEYMVEFSDEKLAEDYFVNGEFKEYFWEPVDLEDLARTLTVQFHSTDGVMTKFIEGYGDFVYDLETRKYVCEFKDFGKITVTEESEIYDEWCTEVDE